MMRTMNTKDGFAMIRAIKEGFPIGVISGAKSKSIVGRFESLGIHDVFLDSSSKTNDLNIFLNKYSLDPDTVIYMGDDLPDISAMKMVGLPTCPQDAAEEVQGISKYISNFPGGKGCVRDIIEQVLRAQGKWYNNEE